MKPCRSQKKYIPTVAGLALLILTGASEAAKKSSWTGGTDKVTTPAAVGIGRNAAAPDAMLHVDGGIKMGNDSAACDSAKAGTVRWTGEDFEGCTGTAWVSLTGSASSAEQKGETVPTVTSDTGRVWMDRNLGATQVATALDDRAAYGALYQWGRGTDGHEQRNSKILSTLSSSAVPDHSFFIYAYVQPQDWLTKRNDALWQGVDGTNNPCPAGFRLPTSKEWQAEIKAYGASMKALFNSPLKLTATGSRCSGFVTAVMCAEPGTEGYYWSSTISPESPQYAEYMYFNKWDGAQIRSDSRATGMGVRCIKDQ